MKILITISLIFITSVAFCQTTVIMTQKYGVYFIPCKVNGIALDFIFDTGASDVTISDLEAKKMKANGFLKDNEILGDGNYSTANGDIVVGTNIILRTLEIGGKILYNVNASIVHTEDAPLLLGQSALQKFGKFSVDYSSGILTLGSNSASNDNNSITDNSFMTFIVSGYAKYQLGNFNEAILDYNRAIVINPDFEYSYLLRGISKKELGDNYGAMTDYSKAIQINPYEYASYYDRAYIKNNLGDIEGALDDYNKAIQISPSFIEAYRERGMLKYNNQDYTAALDNFTKWIQIEPENDKAYFYRGRTKEKLADYLGSNTDYTKAIQLNPYNANFFFARSFAKKGMKDNNGAMADLTKAIEIDSNNPVYFEMRGILKVLLNDEMSACIDFKKCLELGDQSAIDLINAYCK